MDDTAKEELFVLRRDEADFLVYAPLRRAVVVANGSACQALAHYLEHGEQGLCDAELKVIEGLRAAGMLGDPIPTPPVFGDEYGFCPHEVTLFPTSRCNLRCRYCYADAGRKSVDMLWPIAEAAIDLVATNAGLLGSPLFAVGFHGGGEPMMAWEMVARCVDYARGKAESMGLKADIFAATNGVLNADQRRFVADHFTTVNVSLDGPPEIQNHNRPCVNGQGSSQTVEETLRYFEDRRFPYGIRTTITAETAPRILEIVDWILARFKPTYLHLEPIWWCGRCATSGIQKPSDKAFVDGFLAALGRSRELGVEIHYSGARLDVLTSKFCAAPGDNFTVLPEGVVTSCFEITELDDPRAAIFHYGRFQPETGSFRFDQQRLTALRRLSVEHLDFCADCFCKWHCAGDCLAKVLNDSQAPQHRGSTRCKLNRALTRASLEELVQQADSVATSPSKEMTRHG